MALLSFFFLFFKLIIRIIIVRIKDKQPFSLDFFLVENKKTMATQFRLTKEESALMDECRKSSFWYRSVPMMAITTAFLTYRRLNSQVAPRFYGAKIAAGLMGAYLLGKLTFIPECRRMILERLPNSNLAHSIESKPYDLINDMAQPPEIVSKSATNNLFGARNSEDDQPDAPLPADRSILDTADKNSPRRYVTYDELRQKNRAEYASKFAGPKTRTDVPATNVPPPVNVQESKQLPPLPLIPPERTPSVASSKRSNARKNQYGDDVFE